MVDIDGLVQDCSNSSALAKELLQSCTEPSILSYFYDIPFVPLQSKHTLTVIWSFNSIAFDGDIDQQAMYLYLQIRLPWQRLPFKPLCPVYWRGRLLHRDGGHRPWPWQGPAEALPGTHTGDTQVSWPIDPSLLWHHNGIKKTSKLRVTGLCAGNSPVTGEFPAQMASNTENVSIW